MSIQLNNIFVENFKSFGNLTQIPISDLSVLMGANSSGKSTALQTLLVLKQTLECNSPDIDLLLSGKYVTLGEFKDVINNEDEEAFELGMDIEGKEKREDYDANVQFQVFWDFSTSSDIGICLKQIKYITGERQVEFIHTKEHIYDIFVDGKRTILSMQINNLNVKKIFVNYNSKFNNYFYELLKNLYQCFSSAKSTLPFRKDKIIAFDQVESFYLTLFRMIHTREENINEGQDKGKNSLSKKIYELINNYSQYQGGELNMFSGILDTDMENMLQLLINEQGDTEKLSKIISKYEKIYKEFAENDKKEFKFDARDERSLHDIYRIKNIKGDDNQSYTLIDEAYIDYCEILGGILNHIYYLGPIREQPQGLYNIGFESEPKYVGTTGSFFASVLLNEKDKIKEYIFPNNEKRETCLTEALNEWVSYLDVASEVDVKQDNSFGFSVSIRNKQQVESDIMNVGIGTSQVLPVLIMGLLSEEGEYLIFEQPELHLHPYSQSRLVDFFVELAKNGRKIIVETHSEYFLLRLRYNVIKNVINQSNVIINFFQNKDGTQVSQGELSEFGNLEYPEDFKDETQQLLDDLMHAVLTREDK